MTGSGKLFEAIRSDDLAQIAQLLEAEPALVQARNEQGVSAVMMACYMGRKDIRDLLLRTGALLELDRGGRCRPTPSRKRNRVARSGRLRKVSRPMDFL